MDISKIDYESLFSKIGSYAKKAGAVAARPVLTLYYVLRSPDTPRGDKVIIYAALAYLLLPINFISAKRFRLIGWVDEAAAIAITYKKVKNDVTPEIQRAVDDKLHEWFPDYTDFTEVQP